MKNYSELGTLLTREEARKIRGGAIGMCPPGMVYADGVCIPATDCFTTCPNGKEISITACTCIAVNGVSVECIGGTQTLKKTCI